MRFSYTNSLNLCAIRRMLIIGRLTESLIIQLINGTNDLSWFMMENLTLSHSLINHLEQKPASVGTIIDI